jgi:hypothetical protein
MGHRVSEFDTATRQATPDRRRFFTGHGAARQGYQPRYGA